MKTEHIFAILALGLAACGDGEIVDDEKDGTETSEPSSSPTSEPSIEESMVYLEPAAIGIEYVGLWDEAGNSLNSYIYPDVDGTNNGVGTAVTDVVRITLASLEYFTQATTDEERAYQSCEMLAYYYNAPSEFESHEFDWDAGYGSTGNVMSTWSSFEGFVGIIDSSMSERCLELDPNEYVNGDPIDAFDGMRVGIAFGEMTEHIESVFEDYTTDDADFAAYWEESSNSYMTQYVAINHPNSDEASGFDFIGYDWNYTFLVEVDMEVCESVLDEEGELIEEICGEFQVNAEDSTYVLQNADLDPRLGFVSGGSFWLEDFPNLDLDLLKLGYDPCDFAGEYLEGCPDEETEEGGTDEGETDDGGSDEGGTEEGGE